MPEMAVKQARGHVREMLDSTVTGEMRVMGREGDTRVTWNARDVDEVAAAREQFDRLRARGFLAFAVGEGGAKGEQITEFDPNAQKMILAPPMAGGC